MVLLFLLSVFVLGSLQSDKIIEIETIIITSVCPVAKGHWKAFLFSFTVHQVFQPKKNAQFLSLALYLTYYTPLYLKQIIMTST
jgi:hypothetical protein